jgi:hypothetical protein
MDPTSRIPDPTPSDDVLKDREADLWAERERKRRKAWLNGPSEEEKKEWLESRSRSNRDPQSRDEDVEEGRRIARRWERDIVLAISGLASRLVDSRYAVLGNLVREGREWEEEKRSSGRRRRRVFSEDDDI